MKVRVVSILLLVGALAILVYLFQQNDFLPALLRQKEISAASMLLGLVAAFLLGAVHALSPGHGKTLVAAYLVGSRGTAQHALFLGALVTFTHTISVFLLGLSMLFLSQYILPEKIVPWLGAISGISIVIVGLVLFRTRLRRLLGREASHHHHGHNHDHDVPHTHSVRLPEGEISAASLIALGVSGGLVPCPSALVLLLSAIAIGRTGFGLFLLVSFSLGLALVLMAIGLAVVSAKSFIPENSAIAESRLFQWLPVLSALAIICVGMLMTGTSLGIFKPIG